MPHTSHRKPSSTRAQKNKRTQSTDSQGWTTIHQGLKPSAIAVFPSSPPVFNCTTSPQTTDFDFTDLRARYTQHKSRWDRSTCNERLRTVLRERLELGDIKGLKKCICLGLGSLAEGPLATKALYQLAALESMLDILRHESPNLQTYAQDPAFTSLDELFLTQLDITVLHTPAALSHIGGSEAFIYAPHCTRTAFLECLQGKGREAGLVIGNDIRKLVRDGPLETPEAMLETGNAFLAGRRSSSFPGFEIDETVFWDMQIYWRDDESSDMG